MKKLKRLFWRAVLCEPEERAEIFHMPHGIDRQKRAARYEIAFGPLDFTREIHQEVMKAEVFKMLASIDGHLAKLASTVKSGTRHRTGTPSITTGHWND